MRLSVSTIRTTARTLEGRTVYLIRHYWMAALFALGLALAQGTAYAQVGGLEGKLTTVMTNLATVGRPMAGLGLMAVVLSYIAEPALPDWAEEKALWIFSFKNVGGLIVGGFLGHRLFSVLGWTAGWCLLGYSWEPPSALRSPSSAAAC
jgi:hypothetical protein